jgi:hypothetical protein
MFDGNPVCLDVTPSQGQHLTDAQDPKTVSTTTVLVGSGRRSNSLDEARVSSSEGYRPGSFLIESIELSGHCFITIVMLI